MSQRYDTPVEFRVLPHVHPADGFQIGMRRTALVRPDGHVRWRAAWTPENPIAEVGAALAQVLGKT